MHSTPDHVFKSGQSLVMIMARRFNHEWPIWLVASVTCANGVMSLASVLVVRFQEQPQLSTLLLPFGLYHWSRLLTLAFGFMLIYLSLNLIHRKRAAWWLATILLVSLTVVQLGRGNVAYYTVLSPAVTVALLLVLRKRFTIRSEPASVTRGLAKMGVSFSIALIYGTLGFWVLYRSDFGVEFHLLESFARTVREFILLGNSDLSAHTRHARWFLDSLRLLGALTWGFAAYSLFRPAAYRLRTLPQERLEVRSILESYGRSSLDFFKLWPDKSYFFSDDHTCVIAYRVSWGVAICLGDPVGPREQLAGWWRSSTFYRICLRSTVNSG
jgi:phosphatidylglycerol lysyltransferase